MAVFTMTDVTIVIKFQLIMLFEQIPRKMGGPQETKNMDSIRSSCLSISSPRAIHSSQAIKNLEKVDERQLFDILVERSPEFRLLGIISSNENKSV